MLVVGTRPQIIKSAPIIHEAEKHSDIQLQLVHTGQHYDSTMSNLFLADFNLPQPRENLEIGSGSHAYQTGHIILKLEKTIQKLKPDILLVPGDTNSALASALTAVKLHVPVGHVEAGARSFDMRMPEEVNRLFLDHCANLLFAPSENCVQNLLKEGIQKEHIFLVGDTLLDVLQEQIPTARKSGILDKISVESQDYLLVTLHRPENVDSEANLKTIVASLLQLKDSQIVFPVHPRTRKALISFQLYSKLEFAENVKLLEPVSYHDNIKLIENARLVLTDSGGMQKEAFWLETPCLTLRKTTEWLETISLGVNKLVRPKEIVDTMKNYHPKKFGLENPFGDGTTAHRIINHLKAWR